MHIHCHRSYSLSHATNTRLTANATIFALEPKPFARPCCVPAAQVARHRSPAVSRPPRCDSKWWMHHLLQVPSIGHIPTIIQAMQPEPHRPCAHISNMWGAEPNIWQISEEVWNVFLHWVSSKQWALQWLLDNIMIPLFLCLISVS